MSELLAALAGAVAAHRLTKRHARKAAKEKAEAPIAPPPSAIGGG